jgi:hypothetical protein
MKPSTLRLNILAVISLAALALPGPHYETIVCMYIIPFLLGATVAALLSDRSLVLRLGLVSAIVTSIAVARLIWGAVALDGGDFSFDGEVGLVVIGVVLELFVSLIGFWIVCLVSMRRRTIA